MLLRVDSPGFFSCDMGIASSFTFVKGGSEQLWASNGLPLCIDVTMSVTDLYPVLSAASNMALLRQNIGLVNTLSNLAGLNVAKANIKEQLSGAIMGKVGLFTGAVSSAKTVGRNSLENLMESIF